MHPDPDELAAAAALLGPRVLSIAVDGEPGTTYRSDGTTITASEGVDPGADTLVGLTAAARADLISQRRTVINLFLAGDIRFDRGDFDHLAVWDPALKLLHAGIPLYRPDRADLGGYDPAEAVTLAETDEALADRLRRLGYLHVRGAFGADEVHAANAEIDRLAAAARPDDGRSWWAESESGEPVVCRLVYASLDSTVLAALEQDPRVGRLGRLLDDAARLAPDRMEGASVLLKAPGRTRGLSNIPWHQDCGMGGHSILCPTVAVGIQLTGSSAATGNLQVVPGSAGQTLPYAWERRMPDVPVVSSDTEPGDVTVHIADVMHASPEPTGAGGRRTMYSTFYPPALWDHVGPGEAFNDLVRDRTGDLHDMR